MRRDLLAARRDPLAVRRDPLAVRRDLLAARRDLLAARRDLLSKEARIVVARLELYPGVVAAGARRARARAAECAIRARSQLAALADDRTAAARDEGSAGAACTSGASQLPARAREPST